MNKLILMSALTCLICFSGVSAQVTAGASVNMDAKKIPGGIQKFYQYLYDHLRPPLVENFPGGREIVQFTIETDGTVGEIKILQDIGYGFGKRVTKVLRHMPKWTPAMQNGVPVTATFTIPITVPRQGSYFEE